MNGGALLNLGTNAKKRGHQLRQLSRAWIRVWPSRDPSTLSEFLEKKNSDRGTTLVIPFNPTQTPEGEQRQQTHTMKGKDINLRIIIQYNKKPRKNISNIAKPAPGTSKRPLSSIPLSGKWW
jgi:hypothetical protein